MNLWKTREHALAALGGQLKPEEQTLQELFDVIDECLGCLNEINTPAARVTALTVIKARNLALGCYSLTLDGLAQEAGALFRVLMETLELLGYLRLDPRRVEEAVQGRLPSAGNIAKRIDGGFQKLRDHLNENASHFSFSPTATRHLVNWDDGTFRTIQPFSLPVLKHNLHVLLSIFTGVACEVMIFLNDRDNDSDLEITIRFNRVYNSALKISSETLGA